MTDRPPQRRPRKLRKKRPPPVFVEVQYPAWLGYLSFAWTLVGWLVASAAPHLAFVPLVEVLHLAMPAVTVGLIAANLYFAVRNLRRGAHVLTLLVVTGLQVGLFTTLFFQLYAHLGAGLYDVKGAAAGWQWVEFSLAHALRASDVLDLIEAYNLKVQPIKHDSSVVAVFVIAYHVVIDVFFLALIWDIIGRMRRGFLEDEGIVDLLTKVGIAAFLLWLITWVVVAFFLAPRWNRVDIPLWLVENVLRVVDFADIMESFNLRLHELPREGLVGTLTFLCRFWIALGIAFLLTSKKKAPDRRLATPPDVNPRAFWWRRVGVLAGMVLAVLFVGVIGDFVRGDPAPKLAEAVGGESEGEARSALAALRRMGPEAGDAVPPLLAARNGAAPEMRDEITRTLGYLGPEAIGPLAEIARQEQGKPAVIAAEGLGRIGADAAPQLVAVWSSAAAETARAAAAEGLRSLGSDAVPPLMAATTAENAGAHYHWFKDLDRNWQLRGAPNAIVRSVQELPALTARLNQDPPADEAAEILGKVKDCGSAAKEVIPIALDRLKDRNHLVVTNAEAVVRAGGPEVTPEALRRLNAAAGVQGSGEVQPLTSILRDDKMWDDAVINDPATLPALQKLLTGYGFPPEAREVAVRRVGAYGAAAKDAIPALIKSLGDLTEGGRAASRDSLAKIDPGWKKHPALDAAIPFLLPKLGSLPKEEADELIDAFGQLNPADADEAGRAIGTQLAQRDSYRTLTGEAQKKAYAEHLDAVLAPVERMGPKLKAASVPLMRMMGGSQRDLNNPLAPQLRARMARTLAALNPDPKDRIRFTMSALGTGDEGLDFLKKQGAAAVPYLDEILDHNRTEDRMLALQVAAGIGPEAKSLAPKIIPLLRNPDAEAEVQGRRVWMLREAVRTLAAIDKDWVKHPDVVKNLADVVALNEFTGKEGEAKRQRVLDLLAATGPAAGPLAGEMAVHLLGKGGIDDNHRKVFDKIDPSWRDHPGLKKLIPEMVQKMGKGIDINNERALAALGAMAVPDLVAALPDARPEVRDRMLIVLGSMGAAGKEAVAAMAKLLEDPKVPYQTARRVLESLRTIDPDWSEGADGKELAAKLTAAFLKRSDSDVEFLNATAMLGPAGVSALLKRLGGSNANQRRNILSSLRAAGPVAKDAIPTVLKYLKDADAQVRRAAVEALGRMGPGDDELIAPLAALLIDPEPAARQPVVEALQSIDKDWAKSPKLKEPLAQVFKTLSHSDAKTRGVGLEALERIGPVSGAARALEGLIKQEKDEAVRKRAEQLLDSFRK